MTYGRRPDRNRATGMGRRLDWPDEDAFHVRFHRGFCVFWLLALLAGCLFWAGVGYLIFRVLRHAGVI